MIGRSTSLDAVVYNNLQTILSSLSLSQILQVVHLVANLYIPNIYPIKEEEKEEERQRKRKSESYTFATKVMRGIAERAAKVQNKKKGFDVRFNFLPFYSSLFFFFHSFFVNSFFIFSLLFVFLILIKPTCICY